MTPAVEELKRAGVPYELLCYEPEVPARRQSRSVAAGYGVEAAERLGLEPHTVFKTLLVDTGAASTVVGLVPVTAELDLRAVARAAGAKRAALASPAAAERLTGYVVGGISPFGQRRRLPTFVDESAVLLDRMYVSGGRRGLELAVAPDDLVSLLGAELAPLAAPR